MTRFDEFPLKPEIIEALKKVNYIEATSVQEKAIPLILAGKDLIALAKTGSGKTAACAIPICDRVDPNNTAIQALIVVPTRELALQYATETQKIGGHRGVKVFGLLGGEDYSMQAAKLKHGVQVLVATPGRLIDYVYSRSIDLTQVTTLVLDEADEMLSMGFYDDILFIIQCLVHEHQTLLFSATMPKDIQVIAQNHMKEPVELQLMEESVPSVIEHRFVYCQQPQRDHTLIQLVEQTQPKQAIVFCRSRIQVEKVCEQLKKRFPGTDFLHAGLNQDVRSIVTNKFRSGKIRLLIATDVAARGLDFAGVTHVFMYELSTDVDKYIHRSGRTGRYDRTGVVLSLVTPREFGLLRQILDRLNEDPVWVGEAPAGFSRAAPAGGELVPQKVFTKLRPRSSKPFRKPSA